MSCGLTSGGSWSRHRRSRRTTDGRPGPAAPWRCIWTIALALLAALTLPACDRGEGAAPAAPSDPLSSRLQELPFDAMAGLGPHHMAGTLTISEEAASRSFSSAETYDLKWEGWRRYKYRITKEDRATLDIVVVGDKAYQLRADGLARLRENLQDYNYYVQQTWNLWAAAARPFGDALTLTPIDTAARSGRPATRYQVGLASQGALLEDGGGTGTMRTELTQAEGDLWLDDATGVPLSASFSGEYKTVRVSRVPGRKDAETIHRITLTLERDALGAEQGIEAPALAPIPRPQPGPQAGPQRGAQRRPQPQTASQPGR